jgi:serine O-acetyltransferase
MRPRTPEQLWALSRSLHRKGHSRLARIVKTFNWFLHKCLLPFEAEVGENIVLEHYAMGIVIHPQVTIGDNCRIFHHVTLAAESPIGSEYRIILGDNVTIGAHSIVVARSNSTLRIGNNSTLGAGAVLVGDIPPNEVWAGNPARRISAKITP